MSLPIVPVHVIDFTTKDVVRAKHSEYAYLHAVPRRDDYLSYAGKVWRVVSVAFVSQGGTYVFVVDSTGHDGVPHPDLASWSLK